MDNIPNARDAEAERLPDIMCSFHRWLLDCGKSQSTSKAYVREFILLFERDGKSLSSMIEDPVYFDKVKQSPRNLTRRNYISGALRLFKDFRAAHGDPPFAKAGADRLYIVVPKLTGHLDTVPANSHTTASNGSQAPPCAGSNVLGPEDSDDAPGSVGAAIEGTRENLADGTNSDMAIAEKDGVAAPGHTLLPNTGSGLGDLSGVDPAVLLFFHKDGQQGALYIDSRDPNHPKAVFHGLYALRNGNFHARPAYERITSNPHERHFLFYVAPKKCWRISEKLDPNRREIAWIHVEHVGTGSPCEWPQTVQWNVVGQDRTSNRHIGLRCQPVGNSAVATAIAAAATAASAADLDRRSRDLRRAALRKRRLEEQRDQAAKQKKQKKTKREKNEVSAPIKLSAEVPGAQEAYEQAQELSAKGHLAQGAVCVVGRATDRKNASLNGIYLPRPRPFHGRICYKKNEDAGTERFLFYSSSKHAWKLSNNMDDNKAGFAFAKVDDEDKADPSDRSRKLTWRVFDGKAEGYQKDHGVLCTTARALLQELGGGDASTSGDGEDGSEDAELLYDSSGEQGGGSSSDEMGDSSSEAE